MSVSSHDGVGGGRGWTWAGVNLGHCCRFGPVVGWAWWHHASKTGPTEGNIRGVLKPNKTTYHLDSRQSRLPHAIKVSISGGPDGARQKMTRGADWHKTHLCTSSSSSSSFCRQKYEESMTSSMENSSHVRRIREVGVHQGARRAPPRLLTGHLTWTRGQTRLLYTRPVLALCHL